MAGARDQDPAPVRGQLKVLSTNPGFREVVRERASSCSEDEWKGTAVTGRRGFSAFRCAGLVAQPTCLADRSLGSTKLSICMGRLISSPAEGLGKQCPPGAERPSKDAGGQESRKDVCVSRWKAAQPAGRAELKPMADGRRGAGRHSVSPVRPCSALPRGRVRGQRGDGSAFRSCGV